MTFKTYIHTVEVDWVVYPWLMPAVRYEWIQPDYSYTADSVFAKPSENPVTTKNFERLSFDVAILLRANVKLVAGAHFSHRRSAAIRLTLEGPIQDRGLISHFKARKR